MFLDTQDTREKIMQQSFDLLLRNGYDGVSISDIQGELGISRGLLYHYFKDKMSLFLEVIKSHFFTAFLINLNLVSQYTVEEMISYIVEKYQQLMAEVLQGVPIINYDFLIYRAMQENSELVLLYKKMKETELSAWKIVLANSARRGELREGLDNELLAEQFIHIMDGVWLWAATPSVEIDLIKTLRESLTLLSSLIRK